MQLDNSISLWIRQAVQSYRSPLDMKRYLWLQISAQLPGGRDPPVVTVDIEPDIGKA